MLAACNVGPPVDASMPAALEVSFRYLVIDLP